MKKYKAIRGKRIGKKIGNNLYIHKSAIDTLVEDEINLVKEKLEYLSKNFDYEVIKINVKENKISFIQSEDWNIATEPIVGDSYSINSKNQVKFRKGTNQIYHHKWLFLKDNYIGFDVKESKKWSEQWMNSEIVQKLKANKNEKFNCKIGNKEYFIKKVIKQIL